MLVTLVTSCQTMVCGCCNKYRHIQCGKGLTQLAHEYRTPKEARAMRAQQASPVGKRLLHRCLMPKCLKSPNNRLRRSLHTASPRFADLRLGPAGRPTASLPICCQLLKGACIVAKGAHLIFYADNLALRLHCLSLQVLPPLVRPAKFTTTKF